MEGMPGIPTRYRLRVKQRLVVVEYAKEYGIKPASRHFGLTRVTVRQWWRNWQRAGIQGLVPRYPARRRRRIGEDVVALITLARREHKFGANRTQIWLARVHYVRVATETIQRVFRDIGVPHLVKTRRRRPKQLKLFEKEHPGDSVQVDVKVVTRGRSRWVPVHGDRRLHARAGAAALSTPESSLQPRVPPRTHRGLPVSGAQDSGRLRHRVSAPLRPHVSGPRRPGALYQAETPATKRQGRTQPSD